MKFSESGFIHLNLLPLISVIVISQMLCIFLIKHSKDKQEVQHLCWNQSLIYQAKLSNFFNYLEDSYNPSARILNKTLLQLNRSIRTTTNVYAQAALRAAREALYLKQKSLHSNMQSKWRKSLSSRMLLSQKLKQKIHSLKFVKSLRLKVAQPQIIQKVQNPMAIGKSPEYRIKNKSTSTLAFDFKYEVLFRKLQDILNSDKRNIQLKQEWRCQTEILKWRNQWITKIKKEA